TSGQPGQCVAGKFANIKAQGTGGFDQTYATDVKQSASTTQCLDFSYYIPGASNNPKIQVGWKVGEDTQQIIELTPLPENKWHNRRSSFTAPSSSSYQLTFRMIRDGTSTTHYFGLDEIKIYDQSCVLLLISTFCYSQNVNYQCNFDNDMIGDCQFTPTSGGTTNWALIAGTSPISNPTQALSDVTAILSLTTPNNERCDFPYTYTPGNWQMYFCRRNFNTSYTCPTTSGQPGQCVAGWLFS
ncbi:unnamed protein product, partial [Rotaria sp. Silwood1]